MVILTILIKKSKKILVILLISNKPESSIVSEANNDHALLNSSFNYNTSTTSSHNVTDLEINRFLSPNTILLSTNPTANATKSNNDQQQLITNSDNKFYVITKFYLKIN